MDEQGQQQERIRKALEMLTGNDLFYLLMHLEDYLEEVLGDC